MTKLKAAVAATALAGIAVPFVLQHQTNSELTRQNVELRQQHAMTVAELEPMKKELARVRSVVAQTNIPDQGQEVFRLRAEVTRLREEARDSSRARAIASAAPGDSPAEQTLRSLGLKAEELKKRLAQMPHASIPELQFVTEKDWLDAVDEVPSLNSEEDIRRALNRLRSRAKQKMGNKMQAAMEKYAQANGDMLPADMNQLQAYFDSPVDQSMLERYSMVHEGGKYSDAGDTPLIKEVATPVDEEYDTTFMFFKNGTSSRSYSKSNEALKAAAEAYAEANGGLLPRTVEEIQGFLPAAIERSKTEAFLKNKPANVLTLDDLRKAAGEGRKSTSRTGK